MNRSILIVICDFLLVSLLAFSTVDINKVSQNGAPRMLKTDIVTNQVTTGRQDLGDVMRLALDQERKSHDALVGELSQTRLSISQREQEINQRDQKIQNFQSQLQSKEQQAAQLQEQETNLAREVAAAKSEVAAAQGNIANLNQQLHAAAEVSILTQKQRADMEAEARKQAEKAAALERQLADLQHNTDLIQADRANLSNQLQLSQAAQRSALTQVSQLQGEVESQRQVNAKLADGVQTLASKSSELAQEIRDNRPLSPNEIYDQLTTNRLLASFYGLKPGVFGNDSKYKQTQTVLATDGTNTFALCHVQDTPLSLWSPGAQWVDLSGTLAYGNAVIPIDSVSFSSLDPRVVLIPVPDAQARASGCRIYHLSRDAFKFQDAVVAGTTENYYGQCRFQIDTDTPQYVKMDRSSLRGLFGKFNPSSGDLVFSQSGDLLGVMVNNNYCLVLRAYAPGVALRFGPPGHNQPTAEALSSLYAVVSQMPAKLQ